MFGNARRIAWDDFWNKLHHRTCWHIPIRAGQKSIHVHGVGKSKRACPQQVECKGKKKKHPTWDSTEDMSMKARVEEGSFMRVTYTHSLQISRVLSRNTSRSLARYHCAWEGLGLVWCKVGGVALPAGPIEK